MAGEMNTTTAILPAGMKAGAMPAGVPANATPVYQSVVKTGQTGTTPVLIGYYTSAPVAGNQFINTFYDINGSQQLTTLGSKSNYTLSDVSKLASVAVNANVFDPAIKQAINSTFSGVEGYKAPPASTLTSNLPTTTANTNALAGGAATATTANTNALVGGTTASTGAAVGAAGGTTAVTPAQYEQIRAAANRGESIVVGGVMYQPIMADDGSLASVIAYDPAKIGPGDTYKTYSPTGQEIGSGAFKGVGNAFDMLKQAAKDMAPLILAAVGANVAGAALGQPSAFGPGAAAGAPNVTPSVSAPPANVDYSLATAPNASAGFTPPLAPTVGFGGVVDYSLATQPVYGGGGGLVVGPAPVIGTGSGIAIAPGASPAVGAPTSFVNTTTAPPGVVAPSGGGTPTVASPGGGAPTVASPGGGATTPGITGTDLSNLGKGLTDAFTSGTIWSSIIPAITSVLGASETAKAAKEAASITAGATTEAAKLQRESAKEATDLQRRMYEEAVTRYQPYLTAGTNALAKMEGLTGAMPAAFTYKPEQLTTDPGYAFRLSEGVKALERSAAARGGLMSGATGKALTRFGQEMGSQEFQNAYNRALTEYNALRAREAEGYNRLAGLAGVGGTTVQQLTSAGQSYGTGASNVLTGMASNIGNLMVGQGQTAANAALARGSAYGGALNQLGYIAGRYYGQQQPTGYGGGYGGGAGVISGLPAYAVMPD